MLPTELLMFKIKAGIVEPRLLKPNPTHQALIARLIELFETNVGKRRFELNEELRTLEEGRRDYRVVRGLAHILAGDHSTFATGGVLSPSLVRGSSNSAKRTHRPAFAVRTSWNRWAAPWEPIRRKWTTRCMPICRISRRW